MFWRRLIGVGLGASGLLFGSVPIPAYADPIPGAPCSEIGQPAMPSGIMQCNGGVWTPGAMPAPGVPCQGSETSGGLQCQGGVWQSSAPPMFPLAGTLCPPNQFEQPSADCGMRCFGGVWSPADSTP